MAATAPPPAESVESVAAIAPVTGAPSLAQYEQVERQDWHLWLVAIFLMFVLGVSVLSLMFPAVFWFGAEAGLAAPQRAFFGFSVLLALAMVYILQRQATVRRLRRSLYAAHSAARERERQATVEFLRALPGRTQFSDSLAMEFLRASRGQTAVSVLVIEFDNAPVDECGAAARLLCDSMRPGEGLFRVGASALGLVLPGMKLDAAGPFRAAVLQKLGSLARLVSDARTATFPDTAASQSELQAILREPRD